MILTSQLKACGLLFSHVEASAYYLLPASCEFCETLMSLGLQNALCTLERRYQLMLHIRILKSVERFDLISN